MTLREIWWQKLDWLKYQRGSHDAGHAGIMAFIVFALSAVLFSCGFPFGEALTMATFIGMFGGIAWEVFGVARGESWASCLCDVAQFWAFTPISLTLLGNWMLAIPLAVILWVWYVVALKKMYK